MVAQVDPPTIYSAQGSKLVQGNWGMGTGCFSLVDSQALNK